MNIMKIFEHINVRIPMTQRMFFEYYNETANELCLTFPNLVIGNEDEFTPIASLDDTNQILPLYDDAIIDNILFLSGYNENLKSEFVRKAQEAHSTYWYKNAKGRHIKRNRW